MQQDFTYMQYHSCYFSWHLSQKCFIKYPGCQKCEGHQSMGQKSVKGMSKTYSRYSPRKHYPCYLRAQDSCRCVSLEEFTGPAWHGPPPPLCPAHRLSARLFLKRLEFNQNINFLLNPFKAQSSASCFPFHMPTDDLGMSYFSLQMRREAPM